jgi:hypothetical protein
MVELAYILGEIVNNALDNGLKFPICATLSTANGTIWCGRYECTKKGVTLKGVYEHIVEEAFPLPIQVAVCDSNGGAVQATITSEDESTETGLALTANYRNYN